MNGRNPPPTFKEWPSNFSSRSPRIALQSPRQVQDQVRSALELIAVLQQQMQELQDQMLRTHQMMVAVLEHTKQTKAAQVALHDRVSELIGLHGMPSDPTRIL